VVAEEAGPKLDAVTMPLVREMAMRPFYVYLAITTRKRL
jgi:hypothetical protein